VQAIEPDTRLCTTVAGIFDLEWYVLGLAVRSTVRGLLHELKAATDGSTAEAFSENNPNTAEG